jgi:anaerobic selenocysteine-containing dehydrogenase
VTQRHYRTCTICEATCGITVDTDGDQIVAIRGDKDDPFSRGHICPKAIGLADVHNDPDRLRRPLRREGNTWREIGWDEAFDEAGRRLREVAEAHGRDAIATFVGNPVIHNHGAQLFLVPFLNAIGSRNRFSAGSIDVAAHNFAGHFLFGHPWLLPVPDVDRTDFLLVFGANPVVSNGSLMTAPGIKDRLEAIRARGGRLVVFDPRRTETAEMGEHVFVRPGSDVLVLLAILHVIFAEGLVRLGRCEPFVDGVDDIARAVAPYSPERVASATGVDPDRLRELARTFATTERAAPYGRMGISTQSHGALACWLVYVLATVTGHLDVPGGLMFTKPAVDFPRLAPRGGFARWHSRVRGAPEFNSELPAAVLAEEIDTPGDGQIRALVTFAGNPVLSTPNGSRLERALPGLDFQLAIDFYLNETNRHAHLILPPTFALEHDHYDTFLNNFAVRNTAKYARHVFARSPDARHDGEILSELTWRVRPSALGRMLVRCRSWLMEALGPRRIVDLALRIGPHGMFRGGLNVRALEAQPHGVDLGPLEPALPKRLFTRHHRIALAPKVLLDDLVRVEPLLDRTPADLQLIGRRDLRSNNTWLHNAPRLAKGPPRCVLFMHPDDASARGLATGSRAVVRSRTGSIEVPVRLTDEVMPGVVSLPQGWGHDRPGTRLRVAREHAGASINDVTDDALIDPLSGMAGFTGVDVSVTAVQQQVASSA